MVDKRIVKDVTNIIEGLGINENPETISILEDVGTNSKIDAIREMTARALVKKNMPGVEHFSVIFPMKKHDLTVCHT